jgi:cytochrome b6-f complex iron-sulfur subunit
MNEMKEMNRREFVTAIAAAACLCGLGTCGDALADATDAGPTSIPSTLDVGAKTDYAQDGITTTWMKVPTKVAIIRNDGKIYAMTTVCTHRGAIIGESADSVSFTCPRHHAQYDIEGNVTKGPAKVSLSRYAISVDANGHLIVDKSQKFTADQWDDPASFVKVD